MWKVLTALATQLPPLAGLIAFWDQTQQNPAMAATVGVAYEIIVLVGAFGKRVWTELEKEAVDWSADQVRATIRGFKPGFLKRYYRWIQIHYGVLNVRGLGMINAFTLELEQVFVELRIAPSANPAKPNFDPIAVRELAGPQQIWDLLRSRSALRNGVALAIVGPPGSGKSTLLQHVVLAFAQKQHRRYGSRAYFPILLAIREHAASIIANDGLSLGNVVHQQFANRKLFPDLDPPPNWFERRLRRGGCLILLDGLDEVANSEERRSVARWVDRQIAAFSTCRFVITARPHGYQGAPLERANVFEVLPFTARQVRSFVDNWYLVHESHSFMGKLDQGVRHRARLGAGDLLERLRARPALADLTVNPLLLTMIAMVHRYHSALPGSRVQLYADICQVLLERRGQAVTEKGSLRAEQKLVGLRPLAARMMELKSREITLSDALGIVREPLGRVGWVDRGPEEFLREIQSGSGLLLEREEGVWSFAHLSFQEYLTAMHWRQPGTAAPNWPAIVDESWWQETCRLYAAQADATSIVDACLSTDTVTALTLVSECLEEAGSLDTSVRMAAEARVVAGLESTDQARRHLAAEVQLTKRLNRLQRIDEECEIDLEYVTYAEYQLFLDEGRELGKYRQPDHWREISFPSEQACEPVIGIRAEDAEAFCAWLTERRGGQAHFRIPRVAEARAHQAHFDRLAAWCLNDRPPSEVCSLVGLSPTLETDIRCHLRESRDVGQSVPLPMSFDYGSVLAYPVAIALGRSGKGDIDSDRFENRDRALAEAIPHVVRFDDVILLETALDTARIREPNPTLPRARARELLRSLVNVHDVDRTRRVAAGPGPDHDRDHIRRLIRAYDVNRAQVVDVEPICDLFDSLKLALGIAQENTDEVAGTATRNFGLVGTSDFTEARAHATSLTNHPDQHIARLANIIGTLIDLATTLSAWDARRAWRHMALLVLESMYFDTIDAGRATENTGRPWRWDWRRAWRKYFRGRPWTAYGKSVNLLSDAVVRDYWALAIITERESGRLSAWEGIRIVRERTSS